jgi:hypothetical protein
MRGRKKRREEKQKKKMEYESIAQEIKLNLPSTAC